MKILGIDQSYSSSGLVIIDKGGITHAEKFSSSKDADVFDRSKIIADHIVTLAKNHNVESVGIEGLAFGMRGDATRDLAGLQFMIVNGLRDAGFEVEVVAPNAVKKFATGDGRAKKEQLFESLPIIAQKTFLDLGVKKTTGLYDLTDAYWIAQWVEDKEK